LQLVRDAAFASRQHATLACAFDQAAVDQAAAEQRFCLQGPPQAGGARVCGSSGLEPLGPGRRQEGPLRVPIRLRRRAAQVRPRQARPLLDSGSRSST
jgi:hypothetical protein